MSRRLAELLYHPAVRTAGLTLYYLALIAALVLLYGPGNYTPPPFVYQGF